MQIFDVNRDLKSNFERYRDSKGWADACFSDHWLGSAEQYSYRKLTFSLTIYPLYPASRRTFAGDTGKSTTLVSSVGA